MPRYPRPVLMGKSVEMLQAAPSTPDDGMPIVPTNMEAVRTGLEGLVLIPQHLAKRSPALSRFDKEYTVLPDGNRGAFLPQLTVELHGRTFIVGLKGIGARYPMYGEGPLPLEASDQDDVRDRVFTSESWFGESPWGAMGRKGCMEDKAITELGGPDGIHGFHICPMVRATPLPGWIYDDAQQRYWYRKLESEGRFYQQVRLMPSDVRLFYQSEAALGRRTSNVLAVFEVKDLESLDSFVDNYIRSGLAALTLLARTVTPHPQWGHAGLDFDDVWLDKDSVIAPDGTIFFADIEGLDWVPLRDRDEAAGRIRKQFDRNFYEFMYGLDRLLIERDQMSGRRLDREARRQELAARLELALMGDPFLKLERDGEALAAVIRPHAGPAKEVRARLLDLMGHDVQTDITNKGDIKESEGEG